MFGLKRGADCVSRKVMFCWKFHEGSNCLDLQVIPSLKSRTAHSPTSLCCIPTGAGGNGNEPFNRGVVFRGRGNKARQSCLELADRSYFIDQWLRFPELRRENITENGGGGPGVSQSGRGLSVVCDKGSVHSK